MARSDWGGEEGLDLYEHALPLPSWRASSADRRRTRSASTASTTASASGCGSSSSAVYGSTVFRMSGLLRRHVALPPDHGSWGFLATPLLIGLFAGGRWTTVCGKRQRGVPAVVLLADGGEVRAVEPADERYARSFEKLDDRTGFRNERVVTWGVRWTQSGIPQQL